MSNTAILSVRVVGDATSAQKALTDTGKAADDMASKTSKSSQTVTGAFKSLAVPAAAVTAAVGALGKASIDAAATLQGSVNSMTAVFGDASSAMQDYSKDAAKTAGLSEQAYDQLATGLGAKLQNLGVSQDQLAGTTNDLIDKAADMATVFGTDTESAVTALGNAVAGNFKGLKQYGVVLDQSQVSAYMAAQGLDGLTGAAADAARTQAILDLVTQQTASTQGAFADESGNAAGAQEVLSASWENAKASLGDALLPIVADFTTKLSDMADWISQNSTLVLTIVGIIGGLAAVILGVNAGIAAYEAITKIAAAAQVIWNAAMDANPIGLIVLGIAALIAIIVLVVTHFDQVKQVAGEVWDAIKSAFTNVVNFLSGVVDNIVGFFTGLRDKILSVVDAIGSWFNNLGSKILGAFKISLPGWVTKALDFLGLMTDLGDLTWTMAAPMQAWTTGAPSTVTAAWTDLPRVTQAIPTLTAMATSGSVTYNVTVNFNGIVTDKEGTAAEIRDVLNDSARNRGVIGLNEKVLL